MNDTIVRRRADIYLSENAKIEILTREVVTVFDCSEKTNEKHTILATCPDS